MATLRSKPFADHNGLGKHVATATSDMRAFQSRKAMRVSCQQNLVPSNSDQRLGGPKNNNNNAAQEAATADMLQSSRSPLFDLPAQKWPVFVEKENVIVPSALKQSDAALVHDGSTTLPQRLERKQVKFTAEKARLLRKELRAMETFHDKWYHSAIASRLAKPEQ